MLNGLTQLNVELTSRCDKHTLCAFCGHQDTTINPQLTYGDMSWKMAVDIAEEVVPLGKSLVVQFHRDGDPLAAPLLASELELFECNIRSVVTHGERLGDRADEIIDNCESVCVSIFRGDPDRELQLKSVQEFLDAKGDTKPRVFFKVVGDMSDEELRAYRDCGVPFLHRRLHVPVGNSKYAGGLPPLPEHGLCLDLLHHPSIAWDGRVYLCNRLDTAERGLIGNLHTESLDAIWNGSVRAGIMARHLDGLRHTVPACADCRYYGIPAA